MGVVAFVRVACLVLFFRFFPCSYGKRCGGERSFLKNKKAGGGLGGGRSASPPDALGVVAFVRVACLVLFFRFFLCSYGKRCGGEESSLKIKKLEGGWGRGRSASPPDALGVVALVRVAFLVLFFRFFS